ncbi:MAG: hypothetical protein A3E82_07670 [Gammaproteobacteria bacterium RIFCSPHIGHO2_12_FULL_38_11]|nr:MAG: hypothetical protein A3E82_07670 [Gammaproteobacteria bacterium RIFCSPHIGHO2_12_FULL_38_11]
MIKKNICELNDLPKELIFYGGADQARVIRPIIKSLGSDVCAVIDDTPNLASPFDDVAIFEGWDTFKPWLSGRRASNYGFVITIGNPFGHIRCKLHDFLVKQNLCPVSFADPSANIDSSVQIGPGAQIMRNAIVNVDSVLGKQCIINTGAIVEHDDILGDGVEIGPGAILCGRVRVDNFAWICSGATIKPRVSIGEYSVVGAGSVVIRNIEQRVIVAGVPTKIIKNVDEERIL